MLKIPQQDAERLRKLFGNSDVPPYMYAKWLKNGGAGWRHNDDPSISMDLNVFIDNFTDELKRLVDFTRRFPQTEKQICEAGSVDEAAEIMAVFLSNRDGGKPKSPPIIRFSDGFSWVPLKGGECEIEGGLMQHCGNAFGDMFSLRDPSGKPHVTLDVVDASEVGKSYNHGLEATDMVVDLLKNSDAKYVIPQARGKQNSTPDKRYWPYIIHFCKKIRALITDSYTDFELVQRVGGQVRHSSSKPVHEAPIKKPDQTHLTAQRNIPREAVNVMTMQPAMRQTIWQISELPKGTQASRLMRYLEDKGWRQTTISGRKLLYHARSYRLLEPVRPPEEWTLNGVYSLFRPRSSEDDARRVDNGLLKMWGYHSVGDLGDADSVALNKSPSPRFIAFISSQKEVAGAVTLADQLFQHTGIAIEPLTANLKPGTPISRESQPLINLPPGVKADDIIVIPEHGSFYAVHAKDVSSSVVHDSTSVLKKGRTRVKEAPADPVKDADDHTDTDDGMGSDWAALRKRYGMKDRPPSSPFTSTKGRPHFSQPEKPEENEPKVEGDGSLEEIYRIARSEGRQYIYFASSSEKKGGSPDISTLPVTLSYERGGIYGENVRVARNIRSSGGVPVKIGRWATEDLGKYVRMFRRDYSTTL
ncbi:MAG: hypothetical protein WC763_06915 [Candidatus Paceibacterota bacterium]